LSQPWYFASIWTSDDCNLKCAGCFFHESNMFGRSFTPTYMTREVADAVIDLCNRGFISGISFFGAEPMMNWPMVKRILVRTHETTMRNVQGDTHGSVYHITTNGTFFTPENLEDLAQDNAMEDLESSYDPIDEGEDDALDEGEDDAGDESHGIFVITDAFPDDSFGFRLMGLFNRLGQTALYATVIGLVTLAVLNLAGVI